MRPSQNDAWRVKVIDRSFVHCQRRSRASYIYIAAPYGGQDFAVLADGALVEGPRGGALAVNDAACDGEPVHPPELDPVVAESVQVRRGLERPLHRSNPS